MTHSKNDSNRCMILQLPNELRQCIFRHLLQSCDFNGEVKIILSTYVLSSPCLGDYSLYSKYHGARQTFNIFRVCKQFHTDMTHVVFRESKLYWTIAFDEDMLIPNCLNMVYTLRPPTEVELSCVRSTAHAKEWILNVRAQSKPAVNRLWPIMTIVDLFIAACNVTPRPRIVEFEASVADSKSMQQIIMLTSGIRQMGFAVPMRFTVTYREGRNGKPVLVNGLGQPISLHGQVVTSSGPTTEQVVWPTSLPEQLAVEKPATQMLQSSETGAIPRCSLENPRSGIAAAMSSGQGGIHITAPASWAATQQDAGVPIDMAGFSVQLQCVSDKLKDAAQGLESLRSMFNNSNS